LTHGEVTALIIKEKRRRPEIADDAVVARSTTEFIPRQLPVVVHQCHSSYLLDGFGVSLLPLPNLLRSTSNPVL
jgi:hypothetical protein